MSWEAFSELCGLVIDAIGKDKFRSESYIECFLADKDHMYMAHCLSSGDWISGETWLAITLRLLSGNDACDISVIFDISPYHCTKIMQGVLKYFINGYKIGGINMSEYLSDMEQVVCVSRGFSKRSNGVQIV